MTNKCATIATKMLESLEKINVLGILQQYHHLLGFLLIVQRNSVELRGNNNTLSDSILVAEYREMSVELNLNVLLTFYCSSPKNRHVINSTQWMEYILE